MREILEQCDVLCLLYDISDSNSFSPIAGMFVSGVIVYKIRTEGISPFNMLFSTDVIQLVM